MTAYRRLDYRDYSTKVLVREIEVRIKVHWQMMQEERKKARNAENDYMRRIYRDAATRSEIVLKTLLAIRAEAR